MEPPVIDRLLWNCSHFLMHEPLTQTPSPSPSSSPSPSLVSLQFKLHDRSYCVAKPMMHSALSLLPWTQFRCLSEWKCLFSSVMKIVEHFFLSSPYAVVNIYPFPHLKFITPSIYSDKKCHDFININISGLHVLTWNQVCWWSTHFEIWPQSEQLESVDCVLKVMGDYPRCTPWESH